MNITITVIGDTDSPDVQNLLAHLAKTTSATIAVAEPVKTEIVKSSRKTQTASVVNLETKPTVEETTAQQEKQLGEIVSKQNQENLQSEPPKHSAEEVRAAAVAKSKTKREEVKALIESFGTPNLAGLKPEQFNEFMAKLEKI